MDFAVGTIVSGAMAERTKFISYLIYSAVINAVIYPISGHWIWGGGCLSQLGVQLIRVISVIAWVSITMTILFNVLKATIVLRVSKEEEISGLDIEEHGLESCYADFMPITLIISVAISKAIPVKIENNDELEMQLIPKVKVEIIIAVVSLDLVIKTAKQSLYTGNIGDGKIFVYNVDKVIKISTGEEGIDAIK